MKALRKIAPGPGNMKLTEVAEPVAGAGEVVLEVRAAGICGTDLHIEAGEYPTETPVTVGHEVAGVVADVGDGVDADLLGRRAVTETYFSTCGRCRECRAGLPNLCRWRRSIGTHVDGGFAERLLVPAANLRLLAEHVTLAEAAMTEPLSCVCHSLGTAGAGVAPGRSAMVTGPGSIGLLAAQYLRAAGMQVELFGLESDRARLKAAEDLGIKISTDRPTEEHFDLAVECSGAAGGLASCLAGVRRAGHLVVIGLAGKPIEVDFDRIALKQLAVTSSLATVPWAWDQATELIASGAISLEPLITEIVPLTEWRRAFDAAAAAEGVKYLFDPTLG